MACYRTIVIVLLLAHSVYGDTYWWQFNHSDCSYDDVKKPNATKASICCKEATGQVCSQVAQCEAECLKIPECGGFNWPHGVLKLKSCLGRRSPSPSVDLYVLEDTPQPPSMNFPPIWPHPKAFTYGTSTVFLDAGFRITTSVSSDTLDAAISRYQALIFQQIGVNSTGDKSISGSA